MATIASTPPAVAPSAHLLADLYRLTVRQYDRMVEDGTIAEDDQVELIQGLLVTKMPKNPRHMWSVEATRDALAGLLPAGWSIRQEGPLRVPEFDEPEPDLAVIRGTRDNYQDRHPEPGDAALIVEVAETSLPRDRGEKRTAYGRGGIPIYWIVNLVDRQVEVYSNPAGGTYPPALILGETDSVELLIEGQVIGRIAVATLLPRRPS
jgi:Uma2 family endonuclease